MKTLLILLSGVVLAMTIPASALGMTNVVTSEMRAKEAAQSIPMKQDLSGMKMETSSISEMAHGTGVIEAIDTAQGTVTIKHHAIASIHWPAMTMTFKADPPSLLQSVKVGEKVNFTLHPAGMNSTVTDITTVK